MKRKVLLFTGAVLLIGVILVLAGGTLLQALGIEPFCISTDNNQLRFSSCLEREILETYEPPPELNTDAIPIVIDTDMAVDDWMAILFLLQRSDVDVKAITVTGAGEAHCEAGVQNAIDLAALAGRPDIPVSCGREIPLEGQREFPQSWRENVDILAGIQIPTSPAQPSNQSALELLKRSISENQGELRIVALGPLTNLAELFQLQPEFVGEIAQLYIMGGAFKVQGNLSDAPELELKNEVAEWNIFVDPYAAARVVESGAPITFVPLDASNHVPLDEAFYKSLGEDRSTSEAEFIYRALSSNIEFVRSGQYYFWDPLTAAIAVDESLGTFDVHPVTIIEQEGADSAASRIDEAGSPARIFFAVDGERFKELFLDVLNARVEE